MTGQQLHNVNGYECRDLPCSTDTTSTGEDMAAAPKKVIDAFVSLSAAYQVYRNSHWKVQGPNYYGNHLLFQRLYEETEKQVDLIAEQIVGTWGSHALGEDGHAEEIQEWVTEVYEQGGEDPLHASLEAAAASRHALGEAYDELKERGKIPIGWDDLLMSLAQQKDQHLYLLGQAVLPADRKLKAKLLR